MRRGSSDHHALASGLRILPAIAEEDIAGRTEESTSLPVLEGCLISELANGQSGDQQSQPMARD